MPAKLHLHGQRFGRLLVIDAALSRNRHTYWHCLCDCGNEVTTRTDSLRSGAGRSCGCYHKDAITKHGMWQSPEYRAWRSMLTRCENPNMHAYARYGGRGITIREQWHEFENFYADMGVRPTAKHSLERIDNDGNYCSENCRWETKKRQSRNRADNHLLTYDDETVCIAEWSERTGINCTTIAARLRRGWTIPEALLTKPDLGNRWKRQGLA